MITTLFSKIGLMTLHASMPSNSNMALEPAASRLHLDTTSATPIQNIT